MFCQTSAQSSSGGQVADIEIGALLIAAANWAYMDPREDMVGILMPQRLWDSASPPPAGRDFWTQAYSAIDD